MKTSITKNKLRKTVFNLALVGLTGALVYLYAQLTSDLERKVVAKPSRMTRSTLIDPVIIEKPNGR